MTKNNAWKNRYSPQRNRRSIRLKGYDYSQAGIYFVTICTQNRELLFGEVVNRKMVLNDAGRVAEKCWYAIPEHFPHVGLGTFVVMPNHIHGILLINDKTVGAKNFSPPQSDQNPSGTSQTIGSVIRGFKIGVTKWMRQNTEFYNIWQRNYHEHIIRNEDELNRIRKYITDNPAKRVSDREKPDICGGNRTDTTIKTDDPWKIGTGYWNMGD